MSITTEQLAQLRDRVIVAATDPSFIHHDWYVTYHLEIFLKFAGELCDRYPIADRGIVEALVWLHDFGKMLDVANQYELSISEGTKLLRKIGVDETFITKVMEYLDLFEKKKEIDLRTAPIEVQIASSSDAASHMIGPFFALYWKENHQKTIPQLMSENIRKLGHDWERKITLPEVHELMQSRHDMLLEQFGILPDKFFRA